MSWKQDLTDLGDSVNRMVQGALNSRDTEELKRNVKASADDIKRNAKKMVNSGPFGPGGPGQGIPPRGPGPIPPGGPVPPGRNAPPPGRNNGTWQQRPSYRPQQPGGWKPSNQAPPPRGNYQRTTYPPPRSGQRPYTAQPATRQAAPLVKYSRHSGAGVALVTLGGIGMAGFLGFSMMLSMRAYMMDTLTPGYFLSAILLTLSFGLNLFFIGKGLQLNGRAKRFRQYLMQIRGRKFCTIEELASGTGRKTSFVISDLKKMLQKGMFPNAHIDAKETCLILDSETYRQYLRTEEERKRREILDKQEEKQKKPTGNSELDRVVSEGKRYIREINEANQFIAGEEISRKLSRLEQVTSEIFTYVEKHPAKLPEINKFMSYYLPTTLKLLNAYREFDRQPVQGESILKAKQEIESTLGNINKAFENLLDSLFQDVVLDISTDISVLETMLAQEGLTEPDFQEHNAG